MLRAATLSLLLVAACAPRPVLCDPAAPCNPGGMCAGGASGRGTELCRYDGLATLTPKARRVVLDPTEVAFIARGSAAPAGTLPRSATLGRAGDGPRAVLLRFAVPRGLDVLEAYVVVDWAEDGDPDGAGVGLHAERIVGPWAAASATWLEGPELHDARAASTIVRQGGPARLRLDASFLRHAHADEPPEPEPDQGVAILSDRPTARGIAIALAPSLSWPLAGDPAGAASPAPRAPRLELYVK